MQSLGCKLRELRKLNDLTMDQLTDKINKKYNSKINKGMISKWENSLGEPSLDSMRILSDFYKVSLDYLLGIEEQQLAISENERLLLDTYNKLNDLGKHEAIKRVAELTEIPKYFTIQKDYEFETIAAHADDLTEEENNENLAMIKEFMGKRKKQDK